LIGADRVAVYLRDGKRLQPAAARNVHGPHGVVAQKLLDLALGAYRGRGMVVVPDVEHEGVAQLLDAFVDSLA
jgi:hypothetical protein